MQIEVKDVIYIVLAVAAFAVERGFILSPLKEEKAAVMGTKDICCQMAHELIRENGDLQRSCGGVAQ